MPRSGVNGTYVLPGAQATQAPLTPIPSAVNNAGWADVEQTFNTKQPIAYGGTNAETAEEARENLGTDDAANLTKGTLPNDRVSDTLTADKAFRRGNVLGTVSQSSGVPTGALIERGSNSNGEYLRFADGTQICWHTLNSSEAISVAYLGGFRSGAVTWTFPAVFSAAPKATSTAVYPTAFGSTIFNITTSTSSVLWTAVSSQTADTRSATLTAIGRWF